MLQTSTASAPAGDGSDKEDSPHSRPPSDLTNHTQLKGARDCSPNGEKKNVNRAVLRFFGFTNSIELGGKIYCKT